MDKYNTLKEKQINVRFSKSLLEKVKMNAQKKYTTLSEYIRQAVIKQIEEK